MWVVVEEALPVLLLGAVRLQLQLGLALAQQRAGEGGRALWVPNGDVCLAGPLFPLAMLVWMLCFEIEGAEAHTIQPRKAESDNPDVRGAPQLGW